MTRCTNLNTDLKLTHLSLFMWQLPLEFVIWCVRGRLCFASFTAKYKRIPLVQSAPGLRSQRHFHHKTKWQKQMVPVFRETFFWPCHKGGCVDKGSVGLTINLNQYDHGKWFYSSVHTVVHMAAFTLMKMSHTSLNLNKHYKCEPTLRLVLFSFSWAFLYMWDLDLQH